MDQIKKKLKVQQPELPYDARVIVNLANPQGEVVVEQLDLSVGTTREELQGVLNELIRKKAADGKRKTKEQEDEELVGVEDMVYSFFAGTQELTENILDLVKRLADFSTERTLELTYHPQSLFRIKPITRQTAALEGHTQPVLSVKFRNHGDVAITGSGDTTVRLWDISTETPIHTYQGGHRDWVLCVQWSPDGRYFASGGNDGLVCIWDYENHSICGKPLRGHTKFITALAWEPLHLNPECNLLASSSKDGTVMLWSRKNNCCMLTISAHQKCATYMLFGGNGLIYTSSEDTTIGVWQRNGHKAADLKGHGHWVNTLALSTDFTMRTACFSEEQVTKGTKFNTPEEMQKAARERYEKFLNGKGERLVSGSDDSTLMLWEYPKLKPIARMTGHQQPINHVQFSPDGRFIVSASFDKSLRIWDGYNGAFICVLRGHVSPVYQVAWSSDSRMLLSGSKDSTLKLWSMHKQKLIFDLPGHADEVYAIDWAPIGGEKALSGGKDRMVKIWRN